MVVLRNCKFVPFLTEGTDLKAGDVLIEGSKIKDILPCGAKVPEGTVEQDLGGKYLLPGLIDMHCHVALAKMADLFDAIKISDFQHFIDAQLYAGKFLEAGYTTIRDVGDDVHMPVRALRDAINQGKLVGPRIKTSGPILTSNWNAFPGTRSLAPVSKSNWEEIHGIDVMVDGPIAFRAATRRIMADGADFIKLYGSGSLLIQTNEPGYPIMEEDEIAEVVKMATNNSTYVATHAHGVTAIDRHVKAGVHTIEHASMISEETLNFIERERGEATGLVPTMFAIDDIYREPESYNAKRMDKLFPIIQRSLKSACMGHKVLLGWGTDVSMDVYIEDPMREFRLRKEQLDYPNEEILKQATINSAKLMFIDDQVGSVKVGKEADLIVVDGDPVADISVMYKVPEHVFKGGKQIR